MKQHLYNLLHKDMNRREFLTHVGAGFLMVIGLSGLLKNLANYSSSPHQEMGYGSQAYGGQQGSRSLH